MKSVHKYQDEYSKELFDTPHDAIESERESKKMLAEPHWRCMLCNTVLHDGQLIRNRCPDCGNGVVQMRADDVAEMYQGELGK